MFSKFIVTSTCDTHKSHQRKAILIMPVLSLDHSLTNMSLDRFPMYVLTWSFDVRYISLSALDYCTKKSVWNELQTQVILLTLQACAHRSVYMHKYVLVFTQAVYVISWFTYISFQHQRCISLHHLSLHSHWLLVLLKLYMIIQMKLVNHPNQQYLNEWYGN